MKPGQEEGKSWLSIYIGLTIICALFYLMFGCKPCQTIQQTDTVRIVDKQISYVKEYITNDSIIHDTVPCDPTDPVTIQSTIYKTHWKTRIDTILSDKEVIKVNPINEQLIAENEAIALKLEHRNKAVLYLSIALIIILAFWWIKSKFK